MTTFCPSVPYAYPKMNTKAENSKTTKTGKTGGNQFGFRLPPHLATQFRNSLQDENGEERAISPIMVGLVRGYLKGLYVPGVAQAEKNDTFEAPYLPSIPTGPWKEAVEKSGVFTVSMEVADELEARDGDVWVRASGQSMEKVGIMDGFLVLVRPMESKTPRRGDVLLVQVTDAKKICLGTIKRFNGFRADGTTPILVNAEEQEMELPESLSMVDYIGRAVGVIGRL